MLPKLVKVSPKWLLLFIFFTLGLVNCNPKKSTNEAVRPHPSQSKISKLNTRASSCENKVREQMVAGDIKLSPLPAADSPDEKLIQDQIAKANETFPLKGEKDFNFLLSNNEVVKVSVDFSSKSTNSDSSQFFVYGLQTTDEDTSGVLELNITAEFQETNQEAVSIDQVLIFDKNCDFRLTSTELHILKSEGENDVKLETVSYFINSDVSTSSKTFQRPLNKEFIRMRSIEEIDQINSNHYIFEPLAGFSEVERQELNRKNIKAFGSQFFMSTSELHFYQNRQDALSFEVNWDDKKEYYRIAMNGGDTIVYWYTPEEVWQGKKLNSAQSADELIKYSLPENYFTTHYSIRIKGNKKPAYEHFTAYWTISEESKEDETYSAKLTENSEGTISGNSTPEDLASNDTIQTQLPEIQKIADEIRNQAPENRFEQVALVLKYLANNYQYDYSMLENNVVRPLSTEEALAPGKGVCQHYSVIFTAIARALGIPTRIISGYHLTNGGAVYHAWVETQISEEMWKVIEPQYENGHILTSTRRYLPISRADFLEDKDSMSIKVLNDLYQSSYEITPTE